MIDHAPTKYKQKITYITKHKQSISQPGQIVLQPLIHFTEFNKIMFKN